MTKKNNTEIRVRDVAKVEDGIEEKSSIAYYQGNQAIPGDGDDRGEHPV